MKIKRFGVFALETEIHSARFFPFLKELLRQLRCIRIFNAQPRLYHLPSGRVTREGRPFWCLTYPRIKWVRSDD